MGIENLTEEELAEVRSTYLSADDLKMVGERLAGVFDKIQQGAYTLRTGTVHVANRSEVFTETYINALNNESASPKSIYVLFHGAEGAKGKITRASFEFNMNSGQFYFLLRDADFELLAKNVPLVRRIHELTVEQLNRDEAAHQEMKAAARRDFLKQSFTPEPE